MLYNAQQDVDQMESVDLIASGYEWICPNCNHLNHEIEVTDVVKCGECGNCYATDAPEHAYS